MKEALERIRYRLNRRVGDFLLRTLCGPSAIARADLADEIKRLQDVERVGKLSKEQIVQLRRKEKKLADTIDPSIRGFVAKH